MEHSDSSVGASATYTPPIPFSSTLLSGQVPAGEYDVQDLVHALDAAATDDRIKAVVLDLSRFVGGGQVHIEDVGAALDRVRAARKPVLTWAVAYTDLGSCWRAINRRFVPVTYC